MPYEVSTPGITHVIDFAEKDRPWMPKAAHNYNEPLSKFTRAFSTPFGLPAYGKYLRTRDETSATNTYPPMDTQTTWLDGLFLSDCLVYEADSNSNLYYPKWHKSQCCRV